MKNETVDMTINELRRMRWWLRWPIGMSLFMALALSVSSHLPRLVVQLAGVALWFCGYFHGRADGELQWKIEQQRKEGTDG